MYFKNDVKTHFLFFLDAQMSYPNTYFMLKYSRCETIQCEIILCKNKTIFFLFQMLNRLARRTEPNKLLFLGELIAGGKEFKPKMDELVKKSLV